MKIRPLRKILSTQTIAIALLPFILLILPGLVWFLPKFVANIETRHIHLSTIIASKTENHLIRSMTTLQGISNYIQADKQDLSNHQRFLSSQIKTSGSLKAIYIIDPNGKVNGVALSSGNRDQENDLMALDLSGNLLFKKVIQQQKPVWSDTFLSVVGGGISVAFAIPGDTNIVMGEIDLGLLTQYLKKISTTREQMIMVLDKRGQVIADQKGLFTAQQLNLSHIPLIKNGLTQTAPVLGDFKLNGKLMTGCLVKASMIDWFVLIAIPSKIARRPIWTTGILLSVILFATILFGIILALVLARRLSFRFEALAKHAKKITRDDKTGDWPSFNITEFKSLASDIQNMANAIQQREDYNRVLFADSPVPLLVIQPDSAKCVDGNRAALRILAMDSHTLLGEKTIFDLSPPFQEDGSDSRSALQNHISNALEKGFTNFEWQFKKEPGIWYGDLSLSNFYHGRTRLLQISIMDITLRKHEEKKRKKLEEQLRQAQKMESIGTLAGGIAHDFNNILFPVMGYAEMVLDDLPEASPLRLPLQEVLKGSLRAKDLVEQILMFSRQTHKENKPLKLHLILKEVLKLSRATLPTTIEIRQKIIQGTGMVLADPTQIHQIVMNLITNAFHAMEEDGGILTVELNEVQFFSDSLPSPHLAPGWYVCLIVSDTGIGINSKTLEIIFDPYFTTKGKGKGTGLGLAVVHGIVKSYQGEIIVESKTGQGSTFKVYLPRILSEDRSPTGLEPKKNLNGSGHILLIDDEKPICVMIEQMLERLGYRVTSHHKSPDALKAFLAAPDNFDLVITDMTMPDMTGDALAKAIKKTRPKMPIILCSGYSKKINQGETDQIQVDHILMKPVLKNNLAKAILMVLEKSVQTQKATMDIM